jgi:hypothetical protein
MIFIYCIWVSTRWQYNNRKETAVYKRKNNTTTTQKQRVHEIDNKIQDKKQTYKEYLKNIRRVIRK